MQLNLFSCYLLFYLVTLILMNSFESCLDLFNHSKWWCNFEFSIWFSFRKTSKSFVKTGRSISRDDAILKFPFWFFKVTFKRWCNTFWIIFSLVWFIWHSCKRWCNINPLNMFKLVLTFRKKVQFQNSYLEHLHINIWCNINYLYLDLSWSISIYLYLDLSQSISILIYPNLYLSWSIKINLDLSWSILIYHNCFDTHL